MVTDKLLGFDKLKVIYIFSEQVTHRLVFTSLLHFECRNHTSSSGAQNQQRVETDGPKSTQCLISEQLLLVDSIIALAMYLSHVTFFSFLALAIGDPYTKVPKCLIPN